jgi:hypothetical protein
LLLVIAKHFALSAVVHPVLLLPNACDVKLVVSFLQLVAAATATQVLSALAVHAFLPATTHYLKVSVLMQCSVARSEHSASVVLFLAFVTDVLTAS